MEPLLSPEHFVKVSMESVRLFLPFPVMNVELLKAEIVSPCYILNEYLDSGKRMPG